MFKNQAWHVWQYSVHWMHMGGNVLKKKWELFWTPLTLGQHISLIFKQIALL
jgi:hypothetical protein